MTTNYKEFKKAKDLLGIKDVSDFKTIKGHYHQKMQAYHPDKNPSDESSHLKTVELMKAYEIITRYCQNYHFDLSKEAFEKQHKPESYEQASAEYNEWWKNNYGKGELF